MTPCPSAYDIFLYRVMAPIDRDFLESEIGCFCLGNYNDIPKYTVLYGDPMTGKSTILSFLARIFGEGKISYYSLEIAKMEKPRAVIIDDGDADEVIRKTDFDKNLKDTKFFIATNQLPTGVTDSSIKVLWMSGRTIPKSVFKQMIVPGLLEMTIPYRYYCIDKLFASTSESFIAD